MISALLNPALLTFIFGIVIGNIFKNRHPSQLLSKYFGYYLLLGLGLKGGLSLQKTGLTNDVVTVLTLGKIKILQCYIFIWEQEIQILSQTPNFAIFTNYTAL